MAPEVLLNEELDGKLDVYAFSLVFWEILTRDNLFEEYDDKDIFTEDIARKNVRPPLDGIHSKLAEIIKRSWDRDPSVRPTFEELIELIRKATLEIYFPKELCPDAAPFWGKYYPGRWRIPFKDGPSPFVKNLHRYLEKRHMSKIQVNCLQKMVAEEDGGESVVTIERFANLLKWFGKIKPDSSYNVMDRIETVLKKEWFFGDLDSGEAESKLKVSNTPGTFLVRLNMGGQETIEKTPFTISRLDKNLKTVHTRVYPRGETPGLLIKIKSGSEEEKIKNKSSNIEDFISHLQTEKPALCSKVCPGHPFRSIFSGEASKKSQYEEASDEDEDNGKPSVNSSDDD